jgi:hypothetical protein
MPARRQKVVTGGDMVSGVLKANDVRQTERPLYAS